MNCGKPVFEDYLLMKCNYCGHLQDFAGSLVRHHKAVGWCDNCQKQRGWKEYEKLAYDRKH